jgi:Glycosyl hydrolases family 32 N-terminal domain
MTATRPAPALGTSFAVALATAATLSVLAALAAPPVARAQGSPSNMVPPFPYAAREFCVVRRGDEFHLFYTRDDVTQTFANSTKTIGHAMSHDLWAWQELAPVLPVRDDKWDNSHVWAPQILVTDSLYYMFYAGVTETDTVHGMQSIGLATSTDLVNWTRLDSPVFTCAQAPWTYCDPSTPAGGNFRDPYILPDPDQPGRWLLLYAGDKDALTGQMMIGIATSNGDFTSWTDHGPVTSTDWPTSFSYLIESPLALENGGLWYVFYTTDSGHPINYETTPELLATADQWSTQRRLYSEAPNTDAMFGPDALIVGNQTIFGAVDSDNGAVVLWELVWDSPPHFHLITPHIVGVSPASESVSLALEVAPVADRSGGVRMTARLPADTRGRLAIFDLQGRVLATVYDGPLAHGARTFNWHADGHSGIYFARLDTPIGRVSARVAVLH